MSLNFSNKHTLFDFCKLISVGSQMSSHPDKHSISVFGGVGPSPATSAAAIYLTHDLRRRFRLDFILRSSFKSISSRLGEGARLRDICQEMALLQFKGGFNNFQWSFNNAFPPKTMMGLSFFNGDGTGSNEDRGKPQPGTPRRDLFVGRQWTNALLAANVLVYIAQYASNDKLFYWGAKINGLISKGQLWRLVTSSFLHANIGHLLVNCYSLNSVGPAVEEISGPRRFLAVYITSAIASSAMSYWFSKAPSVGASGAIFGLVGSYAVYVLRHKGMIEGAEGSLRHVAQVVVLNMCIGLLSKRIDNWGHIGGLIGGAAVSWFVGPAWKYESVSWYGRRELKDKAPIFSLIERYTK